MKIAALVFQNLIRLIGLTLIVLGILFWTGADYTESLVRIHMQLGVALVLLLWALAGIGLRARVNPGLAVGALLWGFIVAAFGMSLRRLLATTSTPELYRVLHLVVGLCAIGLAEGLGARIKRSNTAPR